jgi:hypothetical protein
MVTTRSPQHLHHRPNRLALTALAALCLLSSCGGGERGAIVNETDDYVALLDMRPENLPNGRRTGGGVIPPHIGFLDEFEDDGLRYPEIC